MEYKNRVLKAPSIYDPLIATPPRLTPSRLDVLSADPTAKLTTWAPWACADDLGGRIGQCIGQPLPDTPLSPTPPHTHLLIGYSILESALPLNKGMMSASRPISTSDNITHQG